MKYILILFFLFSFLNSDEIERIESIVKDITQLRQKYKSSQDELKSKIINEKKQHEKIINLQNKIKMYEKKLKTKEKSIEKLKTKKINKICKPKKAKPIIVYRTQKLENPNKFPKLILKKKYIKYRKIRIKAKTYRLKVQADIYNATYGEKIDTWKEDTAFTSNEKAKAYKQDTWIKITGYFIENAWVAVRDKMWIKAKYIK